MSEPRTASQAFEAGIKYIHDVYSSDFPWSIKEIESIRAELTRAASPSDTRLNFTDENKLRELRTAICIFDAWRNDIDRLTPYLEKNARILLEALMNYSFQFQVTPDERDIYQEISNLPDASPSEWQVPEGWKLVPIEPTDNMIKAAMPYSDHAYHLIYKAMIAAAPPNNHNREGA